MLIEFSVQNFKTFKEKAVLSFVASSNKENEDAVFLEEKYNLKLLKSAAIYGANASGKTKLVSALAFMSFWVENSSKSDGEKIPVDPFRLNLLTAQSPSYFEIIFIQNNKRYRYGFEADQNKIHAEWLFVKDKKEQAIFHRKGQDFGKISKDFLIISFLCERKMILENALLISMASQHNEPVCHEIVNYFREKIGILSTEHSEKYEGFTKAKTLENKEKILEFLQKADIGIQDLTIEIIDTENLPSTMPKGLQEILIKKSRGKKMKFFGNVITTHFVYDQADNTIDKMDFYLTQDESAGTQKFFYLLGPVLDRLENGGVLMIDELDAKLHPNLVEKIIALFHSKSSNPKNAQLIFNTHNTHLLRKELFRKDQIWFVDKGKSEAAKLYALSDFTGIRANEAWEKNYLQGKYGGIPILGDFENI